MADALKEALGVSAEVISGKRGEFTVRVDGEVVIGKKMDDFPTPDACVHAVKERLNR